MGKPIGWKKGLFAALALYGLTLSLSCHRDFESPYIPGSKNYAGDEWTSDSNHNGIADSVEKYNPSCILPPQQCLDQSKVLSKLKDGRGTLQGRDMILWIGDKPIAPRLVWTPVEAKAMGYVLTSSDSGKVLPTGGNLAAVANGSVQIGVVVPGNEFMSTSFIATVLSSGTKVVSVTSKSMTLNVNRDTIPDVTWTPSDATAKEFYLQSDNPDIVRVAGQKLIGIAPGKANITLETTDGGKKTAFAVTVENSLEIIFADSIVAEEMFLVSGAAPESPILHWYPKQNSNQRYNLLSMDTSIASLNSKKDMVIPKDRGTARVFALALDGSAQTSPFFVHVSSEFVPVQGISVTDMNLVVGSDMRPPMLTWLPANATNRKYILTSGSPDVAIAQGGLIYPVSMGISEFTVKTQEGGYQDTFFVNVGRADSAIHVDSVRVQDISLTIGTDRKPLIAWYPENIGNRSYTLKSLDSTIAIPMGDLIHPVKMNTTIFTLISDDGGKTATFRVTVYEREIIVTGITSNNMSLILGGTDQVPVLTPIPSNATKWSYSLTSSDSTKVSIVGGNKIHANAVGNAVITIRSLDGGGATTTFTVVVNANSVRLTSIVGQNFTMNLGDSAIAPPNTGFNPPSATNKTYTLKAAMGSPIVATIVGNKVFPVNLGKAEITITSAENPTVTGICTVTVVSMVRGIVAKNDTIRVGAGDKDPSEGFSWTPSTATNKSYQLKSSDTTKVRITSNGQKYTGVSGGAASLTVTAQGGSGVFASFNVTVFVPVTSFSAMDYKMKTTDPLFITRPLLTFLPDNATDKNWTLIYLYPSASPAPISILELVEGWKFLAHGPGVVGVIAISFDNRSLRDTFMVTVIRPVTSLSASPISMKVGDADKDAGVVFNPTDASNKNYTLSSSSPATVTIVGNKIHAVAVGQSTITATSTYDTTQMTTFLVTVQTSIVNVISVTVSEMVLHKNTDTALTISWNPTNASNKGYSILPGYNTSIVSVLSGNVIHGIAGGKTSMVLSTTDGGKLNTFNVTVIVPVTGITAKSMSISEKDTSGTLPAITFEPLDATNKGYTLTDLGGNGGGSVTFANGRIFPLTRGNTQVEVVTTDGGFSAIFSVQVTR